MSNNHLDGFYLYKKPNPAQERGNQIINSSGLGLECDQEHKGYWGEFKSGGFGKTVKRGVSQP